MAIASRGRMDLQINSKIRETSPERTKIWTEPKVKQDRKVSVIYYLCRNGQLEQPHFMEVNLSSSDGLHLNDVINRLNLLRGKGMASMYSWSCKRSYKNGFVWHDLSENDLIYPAHGHEYVLKGSELLEPLSSSSSSSTAKNNSSQDLQDSSCVRSREISSSTSEKHLSSPDTAFPVKKNCSWGSPDLNEYKVYKAESTAETAGKAAADAATQTDDKRRRTRDRMQEQQSTELSREEISPPPSSSSPSPDTTDHKDQNETLEPLIKADGHQVISNFSVPGEPGTDVGMVNNAKIKASTVLVQLISCGLISVKDHSLSLISHYRPRFTRGSNSNHGLLKSSSNVSKEVDFAVGGKEYFSGSLIETKLDSGLAEIPSSLNRSSSYNADRSLKMDLMEKEIDGVRARCIPRKTKSTAKKESNMISRSIIHPCKQTDLGSQMNPVTPDRSDKKNTLKS